MNSTLWMLLPLLVVADFLFWIYQARMMQKSGHLPWRRPLTGMLAWRLLTPLIAHLFIGKVVVVNGEKARASRGRRVFVAKHTFQMDFNLVAVSVRALFYYMTLTSELRGIRGFIGVITGSIPVDTTQPHGGAAATAASKKALVRSPNASLLIFPEAGLRPQWPLDRAKFKNGAVRIAQEVRTETGEEVYIYAAGTCYVRDKDKAFDAPTSGLVNRCRKAFGKRNYGGVIVWSDAIPVSSLPADPDQGMDKLFAIIEELTRQAMQLAGYTPPAGDQQSGEIRE
jgi:1-acyl-sn-glycerol-3-phosphate acyltransferase